MDTPHCLILGGTRGIGRALARRLAAAGQALTVVARREPEVVEPALQKARYVAADLTRPKELLDRVREAIRGQGPLTGLVFLQRFRGDGDPWTGEIETTLSASHTLVEHLVSEFAPDGGAIVMVSSNAGRFIARNQPVGYHVAKAGLTQMVRYYAAVLGRRCIRVNAVSPCAIVKEESRQFYEQNAKLSELYRRITPLGRMGTAEEVAQVIGFLLGPEASFVTGQELYVDGGLSLPLHDALAREVAGMP
jgi:NAD(P)-dependent dehydrogenase (short-subunit alcohol dehydrogenase family)